MRTRHLCLSVFFSAALSLITVQNSFASSEINQYRISEDEKLNSLMELSFSKIQELSPEFATYVGATREYNDRWTDYSEKSYFEQTKLMEEFLNVLEGFDSSLLSYDNQINLKLLKDQCVQSIDSYALKMHLIPLDHLSGIPFDIEHILQSMPKNDKLDYDNIISRLKSLPVMIEQTIDLLKKGMEKKITLPKVIIPSLSKNILNMIPEKIELSLFYEPFLHELNVSAQKHLTSQDLKEYRESAVLIISSSIFPAYKRLYDFVLSDYFPSCREAVGACALENGKAWYEFRISQQTTTKLTPGEIHAIGLDEVKRIHQEMEQIIKESGFNGSVEEYYTYLNTSKEFFYDDESGLLEGYREITSHIENELPKLFTKFPKLRLEIVPMPSHIEDGQIGAYYMRGSLATNRPGKFYVNTFDLSRRPKWQMESLALHEGVPGHHFQISIAQEIENMPEFRKYTGYTAYIEGWGLYSESLGLKLGLYTTSANKVGRLIEEIWRATRLVVDTGIHAFGWSRDEAIAYFVKQTGMSVKEATTEVDRYIVWPGQALAYKIGELSIIRMREEAKTVLKDSFDIRKFHDKLLELGALPLDICEEEMRSWTNSFTP